MKKSGRRAYLKEYKRSVDGGYVYTGERYAPAGDGKRSIFSLCVMTAVLLAAVLIGGCVNVTGMRNTFYVILPYIGEAAALFALCWQLVRLVSGGKNVKAYVLNAVKRHLPTASLLVSVFAAAVMLAHTVFLFLDGLNDPVISCVLFYGMHAASLALGLFIRKLFLSLEWRTF
ncbi:MAG: hypothetical protein IJT27_04585 [Clostridia bacterium]|nr:hypothetical protein [Clostridia bacterium]